MKNNYYTVRIINEKILFIKELVNYFNIKDSKLKLETDKISESELLSLIKVIVPEQYDKFISIINDYNSYFLNCKKLNEKEIYPSYTLCMHPSRKCNLNCKYCFAVDNENLPTEEIDIELAKKAINFMVYNWGKDARKFTVDIAGSGEPLLKLDFVKELSSYCKNLHYKTGKEIKIMFPSNGTLMTPKIAEYFENENNILLGFSLDGNKLQNGNRMKKNGEWAYDDSVQGINMIKKRKYGIAVTITHLNEDVDEVYDFLINNFKNVDAISMQVVREYSNSDVSFYNIDIQNLLLHYKKLTEKILCNFDKKKYEYILPLLLGADTFGAYFLRVISKGKIHRFRCGAGRCIVSVDNTGKLYSCSVENGNSEYEIGDIFNGIDEEKVAMFSHPTADFNSDCKSCWASYICGGECFVTAKKSRNNFYLSNKSVCEFRKGLIEICIIFAQTLLENYPKAYEYIIKTLKKRTFFESIVDSSAWAIGHYLDIKNIDYKYEDIECMLDSSDIGTSPENLKQVLNRYSKGFTFYEITDEKCMGEIKLPAIALLNRMDNMYYEYAVIKKVNDNVLTLKTNFNDDDLNVSVDDFFDRCSNIVGF